VKKVFVGVLIIIICLLFTGCWDYVNLNEIDIVLGIGIDKGDEDNYKLTFEVVDLANSNKQSGITTFLLESSGSTIFDTVRNAKKKSTNKIYFGNVQIVILSEEIAREGIGQVIDFFMRDLEPREALNYLISKEKTAGEVLSVKGIGSNITSLQIYDVIYEDEKDTASSYDLPSFEIFNLLHSNYQSIALPAFRIVDNNGEPAAESDGLGVFKGDKLIGFLTPAQTKYYLFTIGRIKGGVLPLKFDSNKDNMALEIKKSHTKKSFTYEENKLKFKLDIMIEVSIGEDHSRLDFSDKSQVEKVKKYASEMVKENVKSLIETVQRDFGSDIFGFGKVVYRRKPSLWHKIENNWDEEFKKAEADVNVEIKILNTGLINVS